MVVVEWDKWDMWWFMYHLKFDINILNDNKYHRKQFFFFCFKFECEETNQWKKFSLKKEISQMNQLISAITFKSIYLNLKNNLI